MGRHRGPAQTGRRGHDQPARRTTNPWILADMDRRVFMTIIRYRNGPTIEQLMPFVEAEVAAGVPPRKHRAPFCSASPGAAGCAKLAPDVVRSCSAQKQRSGPAARWTKSKGDTLCRLIRHALGICATGSCRKIESRPFADRLPTRCPSRVAADTLDGMNAPVVIVEAHLANGLPPAFSLVGWPIPKCASAIGSAPPADRLLRISWRRITVNPAPGRFAPRRSIRPADCGRHSGRVGTAFRQAPGRIRVCRRTVSVRAVAPGAQCAGDGMPGGA